MVVLTVDNQQADRLGGKSEGASHKQSGYEESVYNLHAGKQCRRRNWAAKAELWLLLSAGRGAIGQGQQSRGFLQQKLGRHEWFMADFLPADLPGPVDQEGAV